MIELNLDNLEDLARGTAFLATGGGGDPYIGKLMLKHQLEKGKIIKISEEEIAGKCEATAAENFLKDI